nr:ADP-ribosylglycohydrolase family protein [Burkholderia ambifaria]
MGSELQVLPRVPSDPIKRSRFHGCLLGGAVGDALGAPVEFMSAPEIRQRFGIAGIHSYAQAYGRLGAITDDTQMTLFTAEGMLRGYVRGAMRGIGAVFANVTSHAYLRWLLTKGYRSEVLEENEPTGWLLSNQELFSLRAPGRTCIAALRAVQNFSERSRNDSKGCGGVMRIAPVGLFAANWLEDGAPDEKLLAETFEIACEIAAITHGHPTGQLAAGVLAVVIARLVQGTSLADAVEYAKVNLRRHAAHEETLTAVENAQTLAATRPAQAEAVRDLGEGWIAEEALAIGLYCALCATDFQSGVMLAVNHGGDSDSTGAITGNLLGAMKGVEAIPMRWLAPLELRGVIEAMADDLATVREWEIGEYDDTPECDFYWKRYPGF